MTQEQVAWAVLRRSRTRASHCVSSLRAEGPGSRMRGSGWPGLTVFCVRSELSHFTCGLLCSLVSLD